MRIIGLAMHLNRIRICPDISCRRYRGLRPRECHLQCEAGRIPTCAVAARTGESVDLFHSGKGLGHLRRHNRDWTGRSMGGREQEQFLFRRVRGARGAPRVCEHAVLSGACRRARAFQGGSRQCLLLQCASHVRRRSQAVLFSRPGRQRPGQVSDRLLPVEHFKSQEVIVWGRHGLSGNGLWGTALLPIRRAQLASLPASPQRLREATEPRSP